MRITGEYINHVPQAICRDLTAYNNLRCGGAFSCSILHIYLAHDRNLDVAHWLILGTFIVYRLEIILWANFTSTKAEMHTLIPSINHVFNYFLTQNWLAQLSRDLRRWVRGSSIISERLGKDASEPWILSRPCEHDRPSCFRGWDGLGNFIAQRIFGDGNSTIRWGSSP